MNISVVMKKFALKTDDVFYSWCSAMSSKSWAAAIEDLMVHLGARDETSDPKYNAKNGCLSIHYSTQFF